MTSAIALNRTHAMAAMRARGGLLVRAIERRRRRLVAERVLDGPHRRVVDVGCEDAWMASAWADAVERIVLVDVDARVLGHAALAGRDGVATLVADATDPVALARGLEPAGADVVVLSALLEHLPEPGRALEALTPFLAPHGRFVVYVPADGPILLAKRLLRLTRLGGLVRGLSLDPAPGHVRTYDRRALGTLLARHGTVQSLTFDPLVLGYVAVLVPRAEASPCAAS
jgi:SAM-dependent methyltransferase